MPQASRRFPPAVPERAGVWGRTDCTWGAIGSDDVRITTRWVEKEPLSLLFGPFYKAVSPVRTINTAFARLSGSDPDRGLFDYPARLGYWPGAVGLFAFVWLELVYPEAIYLHEGATCFVRELSPPPSRHPESRPFRCLQA